MLVSKCKLVKENYLRGSFEIEENLPVSVATWHSGFAWAVGYMEWLLSSFSGLKFCLSDTVQWFVIICLYNLRLFVLCQIFCHDLKVPVLIPIGLTNEELQSKTR
eukprot:c25568_g1_i4 orf=2210-2524(-)